MSEERARARFRIKAVASIGTERGQAFVRSSDGQCGMRVVEVPIYPPNEGGKRLASRRKGLGLTLRDAAIRLGLLPSTLSGLEHGRMAGDWRALTGALGRRAE